MKRLYLILAILGAIAPYIFFFKYFSSEGINIRRVRVGHLRQWGSPWIHGRSIDHFSHLLDFYDPPAK